jgi:hypothetical protein
MKYITMVIAIICCFHLSGQELNVGLRLQKTHTLYWENGVSVQYSFKNIKPGKLYVGFDYASSRFGSAIGSNALKQDRFIGSLAWFWRKDKAFQYYSKLNIGYFKVNLEEDIFSELPSSATFFAPEIGFSCDISSIPIRLNLGSGLNFEQGEGGTTPGTLLPLYYHLTIYYQMK